MTNVHFPLLDLMLFRIPGLKAKEQIELAFKFKSEDELIKISKKDIENLLGLSLGTKTIRMEEIRKKAENDAALLLKIGIHCLSIRDQSYPPLLSEIFDPPFLLFYRGCLPDSEKPMAAVVGTRKPSSQAAKAAFELSMELGRAGINVVSGLAMGIDAMAHRGNIEGKAATVAVLGSSPDMVYPTANRELARRILDTGGIILSEYAPGTSPKRWTFPARNRIISALSRGTVIVEAPEKSGALITAQYALEQDRDLWVHECGVNSPKGKGTAYLVQDGAKIVSSANDILCEWNLPLKGFNTAEKVQYKNSTGLSMASALAEYLEIEV